MTPFVIAVSGVPGGGKSTLCKMAALGGVSVLADEWVAVFPISGEWWAYGTPWSQGAAWGAPLKALGVLARGSAPLVEKVGAAELAKALAENALLPDDEAATKQAVAVSAREVLEKVKAVRLAFDAHPRVAEALQTLCG